MWLYQKNLIFGQKYLHISQHIWETAKLLTTDEDFLFRENFIFVLKFFQNRFLGIWENISRQFNKGITIPSTRLRNTNIQNRPTMQQVDEGKWREGGEGADESNPESI